MRNRESPDAAEDAVANGDAEAHPTVASRVGPNNRGLATVGSALTAWGKAHEYGVRMGMFMLVSPSKDEPSKRFHGALCDALKADSRVHDFQRPVFDEDWSHSFPTHPALSHTTGARVIADDDAFGNVRFADPLAFSVVVPKGNQPEFKGRRDVPTEKYYVAWDGTLACVLWEQPLGTNVSTAAGRVVHDILADAASRAGTRLYVQACSPGCTNLFTHTNAVLTGTSRRREEDGVAVYQMTRVHAPLEEVSIWHSRCVESFGYFARMKSLGRRVRDLETLGRRGLSYLLTLRQERERRRSLRLISRPKADWKARGWRRQAAAVLADLWLIAAHIESHTREWSMVRRRFEESASKHGIERLFVIDAKDDEVAIDSMDLSLVRSALDNAAARLDANALSFATGLAALSGIVGAVAGAIAARLLT